MAATLILSVLTRMPFVDGLLFHDHGDHDIHSHIVMIDDLRDGELCAAWHHHHDDIPDYDSDDRHDESDGGHERSNDPDDGVYTESLLIIAGIPATALSIHCSSSAVIASIQNPSSWRLPRSMLPSDPTAIAEFSPARWLSAQPLRPAYTLDALLQSSHALLL